MTIAVSTPLPALLFAAFSALVVAGCSVSLDLGADTTRRIARDAVAVGDLRGLDVSTDSGEVEVLTGRSDEIEIRTVIRESNEGDAEYRIERDGEHLHLVGECDGRRWSNCSVGFQAVVPAGFDVAIETHNGRVAVDGIAGDLDIETDNGAIEGDRLEAAAVQAQTDNGRIQLRFDATPDSVDSRTDNGAITIRLPGDDAYDVDADSDNGSVEIDVRVDPTADRRVVARSDNGAVDIGYREASS